jgi:biopolymer transport protein ExbD
MPKIESRMDVSAEGDMTAMIDMTFQLIAFFMILINFADSEANQEIKLPASQLAIPPEAPPEDPIVLQMDKLGNILYSADGFEPLAFVKKRLIVKRDLLNKVKKDPGNATVIIRADRNVATKFVRELLEACQELGFQTFAFRASQTKPPG